jgi:ABC-type polysaccharide/polyol phosphate export permease
MFKKMINRQVIKNRMSKILALIEKNVKLKVRFKFAFIVSFITPIISILMPIIIFGQLFEFNQQFGPWNINNYLIFTFIAYNINLLKGMITEFPVQLRMEKFWKTLPALLIGPFNRYYLLFGIFFSHLIIISVPFIIFFVIALIYYPISFFTVIAILGAYFLMALILSGIGLIMGVFAISKENVWKFLLFIMNLIFWVSCITYPFEFFPGPIQDFINLNPLYYIFDFVRLMWLENNFILTLIMHPLHFSILISLAIVIPLIGVYIFNKIYKKYGIVGY